MGFVISLLSIVVIGFLFNKKVRSVLILPLSCLALLFGALGLMTLFIHLDTFKTEYAADTPYYLWDSQSYYFDLKIHAQYDDTDEFKALSSDKTYTKKYIASFTDGDGNHCYGMLNVENDDDLWLDLPEMRVISFEEILEANSYEVPKLDSDWLSELETYLENSDLGLYSESSDDTDETDESDETDETDKIDDTIASETKTAAEDENKNSFVDTPITVSGYFNSYSNAGRDYDYIFEFVNPEEDAVFTSYDFHFICYTQKEYITNNVSGVVFALIMILPFIVLGFLGIKAHFKNKPRTDTNIRNGIYETKIANIFSKGIRFQRWCVVSIASVVLGVFLLWCNIYFDGPEGIIMFTMFPSMLSFVGLLVILYTWRYYYQSKILKASGYTELEITSDLVYANYKNLGFVCGNKVLMKLADKSYPNSEIIIPLNRICWIYVQTANGIGYLNFHTVDGIKVNVLTSLEDVQIGLVELLSENRGLFRKDLILGYSPESKAKYREVKKAWKQNK